MGNDNKFNMRSELSYRTVLAMLILGLAMLASVSAFDACNWEVDPGVTCTETTGILGTCSANTVSVYNATFSNTINYTMAQMGSTGVFQFNFSRTDLGLHKWIACDNSTGTITVRRTIQNKTDELILNQTRFAWQNNTIAVWDYPTRLLSWTNSSNSSIAGAVWGFNSRTLNWYNNSVGSVTASDIISIKNAVWNESVTCLNGWKNQSNATSAICTLWNINRFI